MAKDLKALTTSTVDAVEEKNASNIAAANSALEKKIKDTIVPDLIQEKVGVSLTNLATKADVQGAQTAVDGKLSEMYLTKEAIQNNYATKAYASEQAMSTSSEILSAGLEGSLSYLWKNLDINNMGNGYFYTKKGNTDGSYALLYNSSNSSGAQFWNYTKDVMSDINVNNGDTNNSYISLVSKYKGETSNSVANTGARININPEGAYYTKGTNESVNDGSEDNEIATKGDLKHISSAQNFTVNGAEVSAMSVGGAVTVNISSDTAIVNVIGGEIDTSTFVSAVTMQGAGSASIDNGLLNISVPASQEIDTSTFVSAVTMSGAGSASISNGTLNIDIPESSKFTVQGSEVSAISISGAAGVVIDGDTAIINVTGGGVTKLDPNLIVTPATVNLSHLNKSQIVTLQSASSVIKDCRSGNIAEIEKLSETEFKITANENGTDKVEILSPEDATYYSQYKTVAVTANFEPLFDVSFANGELVDSAGNSWETVGTVPIQDDVAQITNGNYFKTTIPTEKDFYNSDFTVEMEVNVQSMPGNYTGFFNCYTTGTQSQGEGIFIGQENQHFYSYMLFSTGSSYSLLRSTIAPTFDSWQKIKVVRKADKAFMLLDDEKIAEAENVQDIYRWPNSNFVYFGICPIGGGINFNAKSLKIYNVAIGV